MRGDAQRRKRRHTGAGTHKTVACVTRHTEATRCALCVPVSFFLDQDENRLSLRLAERCALGNNGRYDAVRNRQDAKLSKAALQYRRRNINFP